MVNLEYLYIYIYIYVLLCCIVIAKVVDILGVSVLPPLATSSERGFRAGDRSNAVRLTNFKGFRFRSGLRRDG